MGFANCLQWRQKAMYVPYGAKCKPLPGRLPRPYHHLPHKAPALAPPCVERPWARKVVRSARGYSSLLLLIAVMLSLVMCIGAALRPEAFSSGLLTHGRAKRIRVRLSLRGHGSTPAKSWDELMLHKAGSPEFLTPARAPPGGTASSAATTAGGAPVAKPAGAGATQPLPADPATAGNPAAVPGDAAGHAAAATDAAGHVADAARMAEPAHPVAGAATDVQPSRQQPGAASGAAAGGMAAQSADLARIAAAVLGPVQEAPDPDAGAAGAGKPAEPSGAAAVGKAMAKPMDTAGGAMGELAAKQAGPASDAAKQVDTAGSAAAAAELAAEQADPASGAAAELDLAAKLANPATGASGSGEPAAKAADPATDGAAGEAAKPGDPAKAAAVQPPPAGGAAAAADAVELARVRAREEAIAEVNRPFDEEYDDDFEGEAGNSMRGSRQRKRRPGWVVFD